MPEQYASIYKFPNFFVVCPTSKTTAGLLITVEPYMVLSNPVSSLELGEAVRRVLAESRQDIAQPTDWKALASPRLAAAGVKSEASFQKRAQLVTASFDGTALTITPHRNGGTTGDQRGFHPIEEHTRHVIETSPEAIGSASHYGFELCA